MPRDDHGLTPAMERELEALDLALTGEGDDPELAVLVETMRAERPAPDEDFTRELDELVAGGFGRDERRARLRAPLAGLRARFTTPRRALLPALGVAATLLLGLVVVVAALQGGGGATDEQSAAPLTQEAPSAGAPADRSAPLPPEAAGETGGDIEVQPSTVPPPTDSGGTVPGRRDRREERTAALTLAAPADEIDEVADGVLRVTDRNRGIVLNSSVSQSGEDRGSATFELQVPTARLGTVLGELSELGDVRSRTQGSTDITGAYVSPRERLTDALAERRALLRQLARADTPNETASIRARLRTASRQIASARAELRGLNERTHFARVTVSVNAEDGAGDGDGAGWGIGDAFDDALRVLAVTAGVLIVALAVLLPPAALAIGLVSASRAVRRRRREHALDAV